MSISQANLDVEARRPSEKDAALDLGPMVKTLAAGARLTEDRLFDLNTRLASVQDLMTQVARAQVLQAEQLTDIKSALETDTDTPDLTQEIEGQMMALGATLATTLDKMQNDLRLVLDRPIPAPDLSDVHENNSRVMDALEGWSLAQAERQTALDAHMSSLGARLDDLSTQAQQPSSEALTEDLTALRSRVEQALERPIPAPDLSEVHRGNARLMTALEGWSRAQAERQSTLDGQISVLATRLEEVAASVQPAPSDQDDALASEVAALHTLVRQALDRPLPRPDLSEIHRANARLTTVLDGWKQAQEQQQAALVTQIAELRSHLEESGAQQDKALRALQTAVKPKSRAREDSAALKALRAEITEMRADITTAVSQVEALHIDMAQSPSQTSDTPLPGLEPADLRLLGAIYAFRQAVATTDPPSRDDLVDALRVALAEVLAEAETAPRDLEK